MTIKELTIELNVVYQKLQDSYNELMIARENAMEMTEIEETEKDVLTEAEDKEWIAGNVKGANAEQRASCLRTLTGKQRMNEAIAESKARRAKVAIDIAKDKVRMYESMKDILLAGMEV